MTIVLMLGISEYLRKSREALFREDTDGTDESGDAARGEGAAGETDEENLVAGRVVVRDEGVGFANVLCQTLACGA